MRNVVEPSESALVWPPGLPPVSLFQESVSHAGVGQSLYLVFSPRMWEGNLSFHPTRFLSLACASLDFPGAPEEQRLPLAGWASLGAACRAEALRPRGAAPGMTGLQVLIFGSLWMGTPGDQTVHPNALRKLPSAPYLVHPFYLSFKIIRSLRWEHFSCISSRVLCIQQELN